MQCTKSVTLIINNKHSQNKNKIFWFREFVFLFSMCHWFCHCCRIFTLLINNKALYPCKNMWSSLPWLMAWLEASFWFSPSWLWMAALFSASWSFWSQASSVITHACSAWSILAGTLTSIRPFCNILTTAKLWVYSMIYWWE